MKAKLTRFLAPTGTTLLVLMIILAGVAGLWPSRSALAQERRGLKNVILMISDGCGYNQYEAATLYQYGHGWAQVYDRFPVKVTMSTYSTDGHGYDPQQAWATFGYVKQGATDSAAAATAMACGVKTYNSAIGVDANKARVKNIMELAKEQGKAAGVVTSVEFSHATPAGFVAHNISRNAYEEIAREMVLTSTVDVIMGAGNPWFNDDAQPIITPTYKYVGGQATWQGLVSGTVGSDNDGDGTPDPWTLVQTREQFRSLISGTAPRRVCGVAQVATTLQQARGGDGKADAYGVPSNTVVPTLEEMTLGALNVLRQNPHGLCLMVEGGAIDWAAHANQSGRTIEEQIEFNKAVEAVIAWVEAHSNWDETLLIVAADHETGYLTGPGSDPTWQPLVNHGVGHMPGMEWHSPEHTNSLVPLFAKGDSASLLLANATHNDPVRGRYLDNVDIAHLVFKWMGSYVMNLYTPVIRNGAGLEVPLY